MLLAIDVGNTQTVIGLYDLEPDNEHNVGQRLADTHMLDHWRVATNAERTADEHALVVQEFLGFHDFSFDDDIAGIVLCSSVPRVTGALRRMSERYFGQPPVVIEPGIRTGVPILVDNPKEVGADRIANAVAAFDLYGGPTIIVDFGTATTCDAVSANGEYLGGAISPGVEISLDALFDRAAALRSVALGAPESVLGRSTIESIRAGTVYGFASQVDGICKLIEKELGQECTVVATGGLSELLAPHSESIQHREPQLTLHGLRLVHQKNLR
jgi:type III pantothenate kinase